VIWMAMLALAISMAVGFALVKALWPAEEFDPSTLFLQFSLACGFGLGATSLLLFLVMSLRGIGGRATELFAETCLLLALLIAWFLRRGKPIAPSVKRQAPRSRLSFFLAAGLAIALASNLASFVLLSRKAPYGSWDGWSIWNLHARFLFRGGQFWEDVFSPLLDYYKPDYPLLIPASIARLWIYTNHEDLLAAALVAAVFTFALALLTAASVARLRDGTQGMLAGLIVLGTPAFVNQGSSQCADLAVAFFFLSTLVLFCLNDYLGHSNGYLALAGVAAGMAAWTKNEGFMLLLVVIGIRFALWVQTLGWRMLWRQNAAFFAGLAPVMLVVLYFKQHLVPVNDMVAGQGLQATVGRLVSLSRYRITLKAFVHQAFFGGGWFLPIVLILAFYALLVGFKHHERRKALIAPVFSIMVAAIGYFLVYIVTPHDLAWQIRWSLDRVFMQLWPAAVFSVFIFLCTPDEAIDASGSVSAAPAIGGRVAAGTTAQVATQ
jgi:Dolichyl-phosphate-mannose-protein mannosyltransferase